MWKVTQIPVGQQVLTSTVKALAEEELVKHEADLSREAVIKSSVCEVLPGCGQSSDCQSLCCADETKAY